jgi:uncharacterized LabA/DUF88 family protein
LFLDVSRLLAESRQQGGEVSYGRLLRTLVANRTIVRAVAYLWEGQQGIAGALQNNGLEVVTVPDPESAAVQLAIDALAIGPRVDAVILVPPAASLQPLAAALRGHGVRVETAGFHKPADLRGFAQHHSFGKDVLFVP